MKCFRIFFTPSFKPQNKIVYKISCHELGLSNYHVSYIRDSPYLRTRGPVYETKEESSKTEDDEEE